MDLIQQIVLGITQGLTEFIPVSSSGHLIILSNLFGPTPDTHLFVQALDFGTVLALIIFFRHKIIDLLRQVFIEHDYRLLRNIIITCIPVATIGLLFSKLIEHTPFFTSSLVIAISLAVIGLLMIFLEKLPRLSSIKDSAHLSIGRALLVGLAQVCALVPGVSRSGSTIITARLSGLRPKDAAEYSFIVSIPVMMGLILKLLVSDGGFIAANWLPILIGNVFAFIAGMVAIKYLMDYLNSHSLKTFGIYRIILAVFIVVLLGFGVLMH